MKNQTRTVGGTVKFKCTVTGYPLPMYTWYKDGERINADFKTVKSGSRLYITKNAYAIYRLFTTFFSYIFYIYIYFLFLLKKDIFV